MPFRIDCCVKTYQAHYNKMEMILTLVKKQRDLRILLCDIAGSLLQGGPLELEGKTYVGDEARKKGMQIIDLIRVLDVYFENK